MFTKAQRIKQNLRMCLWGTSGSGKTWTALALMTRLCGAGKFAVIDTEGRSGQSSAALYAPPFEFDVATIDRYDVESFVVRIDEAKEAGYAGLVIDSTSHAWEGDGGITSTVDDIQRQKQYKDKMRAWADVKRFENKFWGAILNYPGHVICTMRARTAYEVSRDDKGKMTVEKLGLGVVQRENKEYEFDIVACMEEHNTLVVRKSRCEALANRVFVQPEAHDRVMSEILIEWLNSGKPSRRTLCEKLFSLVGKDAVMAYLAPYGGLTADTSIEVLEQALQHFASNVPVIAPRPVAPQAPVQDAMPAPGATDRDAVLSANVEF